jgi:hypothetical protein
MRTFLLTTAAVLAFGTAMQAQDKVTAAPAVKQAVEKDPLTEKKRELSGELKNTLGDAEALSKKVTSAMASAKPDEHEKLMHIANELKSTQAKLSEQLSLVNKVEEKQSEGVFSHARDIQKAVRTSMSNSTKELEALGLSEPVKKEK